MDKKALNLPILTSLVIGNMIGTGIYLLPALLASFGTIALGAWILTSVGAILLGLTFILLNKRFPKTGGPYVYCKEAFGNLVGFIIAYTYWLSYVVSVAGIALASISYLGAINPSFNANAPNYNPLYSLGFELGAVWLFTFINILGIHTAGVVQLVLTIIKILPLIIITLVGFGHVNLDHFTSFTSTDQSWFYSLSGAAALTFWAFIGLESATVPAENTQGAKTIARATLFGSIVTALIYISSTFVLMGMLPLAQLKASQSPFADAGVLLFGDWAAGLIAICAVISGLGALNACILVQGQINFAAARDHLFPRAFAKLSKHDVPIAGQLFSSCLVSLLLILTLSPSLLKQFNYIALLASLLTLVTYFTTTLAELKFIWLNKLKASQLFFSKSLWITLLAAGYALWMIASFESQLIFTCIVILLCCIPIYFFAVRKYAK